jgi:hypothetical protein
MKTQQLYKLIILLLIPAITFAGDEGKGKYTKNKMINKVFTVNSDATLKINNSYGNLDIATWNENRIEIQVSITTNGNDEEKVQKKLDEITVKFSNSPEWVAAETIFNKNKSKSWWSWSKNNNVNMEINYLVKMPVTNAVILDNDYGNINLDKLEGVAQISCDYGKITTKELMADNNSISFDYTNNSYFEYIKSGKIHADYSGYTVSKTEDLDISADYTKSKIEVAENINYSCDYGGITIEKVNNVVGNGDYLTTRIGDVYKNISIKADYGSLKIDKLHASAGNVDINSDYVGIKIGIDPAYSFDFEIDLEYGSLSDTDGFQYNKKRIDSGDKYYLGYHGKQNSGNLIQISSDYGSVTFYNN